MELQGKSTSNKQNKYTAAGTEGRTRPAGNKAHPLRRMAPENPQGMTQAWGIRAESLTPIAIFKENVTLWLFNIAMV